MSIHSPRCPHTPRTLIAGCVLGLMVCVTGEARQADASSLSTQLGERIAQLMTRAKGPPARYRVARYKPLLTEPHANCHAVALGVSATTLDVIHRWDHRGEYDLSPVPWADIVAQKVQYSLSSMYGGRSTVQNPAATATCDPALIKPSPSASPSALPPRCRPLEAGGTLVGHGGTLTLFAAPKNISWVIELPTGHELIDFVPYDGLLLVATRSDQGARDGELLLPYLTTQVFAIRQPTR